MCEFISFFVSVKQNQLVCGNPTSHSNAPVHSGQLDWREAEWTEHGLTVRVANDEDLNAYKATVLALCPDREALVDRFSPSVDLDGNKYYFNINGFHCINGPAVEYADGYKAWWVDGKRHRIDEPAVEYADGGKAWYVDGKCHRIDGPDIEWANGDKEWWVDGKRHRIDGPAIEYANGYKAWWVNGQRHRDSDKPAIEHADGSKEWYVDDKFVRSEIQ